MKNDRFWFAYFDIKYAKAMRNKNWMFKITSKQGKEKEKQDWYLEKHGSYGNRNFMLKRALILISLQTGIIWLLLFTLKDHPIIRIVHTLNTMIPFAVIARIRYKTPYFEDFLGIRNEMKTIAFYG